MAFSRLVHTSEEDSGDGEVVTKAPSDGSAMVG